MTGPNLVRSSSSDAAFVCSTAKGPRNAHRSARPSVTTRSMSAALATPSRWRCSASRRSAICSRLRTKPYTSLRQTTGVWPTLRMKSTAAPVVPEDVRSPGTISTSGTTSGGLVGCATTQRSGRSVSRAISLIGRADVLEARIASGGASRSSSAKSARFAARSSAPLSWTQPAPATASASVATVRRAGSTSQTRTSSAARANTRRQPEPIVPAPTTATRRPPSGCEPAPVDGDDRAVEPPGLVARQEDDERHDVVDLAVAALRRRTARHRVEDGVVAEPVVHRRLDGPRRDRVHVQAVRCQLDCPRLRHGHDRALRRAVHRAAGDACEPRDRGEVDDPAAALLEHLRNHRLAAEERALDVRLPGVVEALLRHIDDGAERQDARAVDEHVDAAELVERAPRESLALRDDPHVGRLKDAPDLGRDRLAALLVAARDDDAGALGGQAAGRAGAHPGRATADDRDPAVELQAAAP